MNELLRFVAVRPAKPVDPKSTVPSRASRDVVKIIQDSPPGIERARALAQQPVQTNLGDYRYGQSLAILGAWARSADLTRDAVTAKVKEIFGDNAPGLANQKAFLDDLARLDTTLAVLKYRSQSIGSDMLSLQNARLGYDLIEQLSQAGTDNFTLRRVTLPLNPPAPPPLKDVPPVTQPPSRDLAGEIAKLASARQALRDSIRTGDFVAPAKPTIVKPPARQPAKGIRAGIRAPVPSSSQGVMMQSSWRLSQQALDRLPPAAANTIRQTAGELATTPATALMSRLTDAHSELLKQQAMQSLQMSQPLIKLGNQFFDPGLFWKAGLGSGIGSPGSLRPVGVGDLMIVRQHLKRYEGGEVGHIENVLKTEKMERDTRRLDRTEQTTTVETETDKEEERDTQSTDRFSLKRETDTTVKTDAQVKAGLSVDAKYGPFVEMKADLQGSYQNQTEDVTKQSTEFSKDVVSRSVSKLTTKVRQVQTTITLQEFEEKFSHGFDNMNGGGNVSGVYQFVDKISEAQIYNYGKRLLFDVMVPEPAAFYIFAQTKQAAAQLTVVKPSDFTIVPADLDEGNYQVYAQAYGATGIDPPPALHKTFSQAWDATVAADPHLFCKSGTINLDDGYAAISAAASAWWDYPSDKNPVVRVLIGAQSIPGYGYCSLGSEQGTLSVGLFAAQINATTVSLEILCERTDRAFQVWQEKAYATIAQAYKQKLSDYEHALAEMQTAQAVAVGGRNPEANNAVIIAELRKACIEQLTTQHFEQFGAIGTDAKNRPEVDLGRLAIQGPFIRFFEQAFEWERIVYFFYPYFWANKETWVQRSLLDDSNDPNFADFLRAGAARVVFPVRPGFEDAVIHYLETGLLWDGGDPPDISSSLYLPIVQEVAEAEQKPGDEIPVGDPWDVRVPTQLIKLRLDDSLPKWKKVGNDWVPDN